MGVVSQSEMVANLLTINTLSVFQRCTVCVSLFRSQF